MAKKNSLGDLLTNFRAAHGFVGRGNLGLALVITRKAKKQGLPIDLSTLFTSSGGQIAGLSGSAVNMILREYGENRNSGTEVGRTSRGTIGNAPTYASFLNELNAKDEADLEFIEHWWVERWVEFFNNQPFKLNNDHTKTTQAMVQDLFDQALKRQRESPGTTYVGAMLQHLIGAKLVLALPGVQIAHYGFTVADVVSARSGDFVIDDTAIHCTTATTEALLTKCKDNLQAGIRPVILTVGKYIQAAEAMAETKGIGGRVEILDAIQFLATNIYELSFFRTAQRDVTIEKLLDQYNHIVDEVEPDKSLKIVLK